jgi:hypothetical protein
MFVLPINESLTNDNDNHLEIFSLIWLDTNDDIEDIQNTEQKLRAIINHFKRFRNAKECQQYIEQKSKHDRLVLIVSLQLGPEIVPFIHKLRQVSSIYVYCKDKKSNEEWISDYTKVKMSWELSICSDRMFV